MKNPHAQALGRKSWKARVKKHGKAGALEALKKATKEGKERKAKKTP